MLFALSAALFAPAAGDEAAAPLVDVDVLLLEVAGVEVTELDPEAAGDEVVALPEAAADADGVERDAPLVAAGELFGVAVALALAAGEAVERAVAEAEAVAEGEALTRGEAVAVALAAGVAAGVPTGDALAVAAGVAVTFVEAETPLCVATPERAPPAPMPMFTPTAGCTP